MQQRAPLQGIVNPATILRWLSAALIIALLALGDGYLLVLASRRIGVYGLLGIAGATGLIPLLLVATVYRTEVREMRRKVGEGIYPAAQFRRMVTLLTVCGLLVMPGFASDAIGLLLLIRPLGWVVGAVIEHRYRQKFQALYEHLRAGM
jgi:UPF0716 family protein affecting phage T7 exclusion